jgi:hypothetical protein
MTREEVTQWLLVSRSAFLSGEDSFLLLARLTADLTDWPIRVDERHPADPGRRQSENDHLRTSGKLESVSESGRPRMKVHQKLPSMRRLNSAFAVPDLMRVLQRRWMNPCFWRLQFAPVAVLKLLDGSPFDTDFVCSSNFGTDYSPQKSSRFVRDRIKVLRGVSR